MATGTRNPPTSGGNRHHSSQQSAVSCSYPDPLASRGIEIGVTDSAAGVAGNTIAFEVEVDHGEHRATRLKPLSHPPQHAGRARHSSGEDYIEPIGTD